MNTSQGSGTGAAHINIADAFFAAIKSPTSTHQTHQQKFFVKEDLLNTNDPMVIFDLKNPRLAHILDEFEAVNHREPTQIELQAMLLKANNLVNEFKQTGGPTDKIVLLPVLFENRLDLVVIEGNSTLASLRELATQGVAGFDTMAVEIIDPSSFTLDDATVLQLLIHGSGKRSHDKYCQAALTIRSLALMKPNLTVTEVAVIIQKDVEDTKQWLAAHKLHKRHEHDGGGRNVKNFTLWQRFLESGIYTTPETTPTGKVQNTPAENEEAFQWFSSAMTNGMLKHTAVFQPKPLFDIYANTSIRNILSTQGAGAALAMVETEEPRTQRKSLVTAAQRVSKLSKTIMTSLSDINKLKADKKAMNTLTALADDVDALYKMLTNQVPLPVSVRKGRPKTKSSVN